MQVIGKYGLKNKREIWRVTMTLAHLRKAARDFKKHVKDSKRKKVKQRFHFNSD